MIGAAAAPMRPNIVEKNDANNLETPVVLWEIILRDWTSGNGPTNPDGFAHSTAISNPLKLFATAPIHAILFWRRYSV